MNRRDRWGPNSPGWRPGLLTVAEAADYLGMTDSEVYALINAGALAAKMTPWDTDGSQKRLSLKLLDAWIEMRCRKANGDHKVDELLSEPAPEPTPIRKKRGAA